jgi:hypothetical protein
MRTTVRLNEDLLARLKQYAAQRNRTMASVLEDAVRQLLDRQESLPPRQTIDLVTFGGDGLQPNVDLSPHGLKQILAEEDETKFLGLLDASA